MRHQTFQVLPGFLGKRLIIVFTFTLIGPPQRITRGVVANNILILRRTTGKNTGINGNSAQVS
ncbi:Uncharacterised protein [Salmonella enterica subsp. enterica serovar Bovismorbificans]|uniref:Uncharacterized protein n=1 Tax=Salmonella enterica subsp. enterica serovar Bovismorbificans TaxID=58097 RepID=A0A655DKC5_SALET|nr:Uncharacterised protein [Salmonella enterica subsp. enterica serovar Bovismorbificans]CPR84848.1 Uncharacterised protein [Salmonella enterica subsp. enterica serovar Bovismorbificans]CQB65815.1 Uncharacterised protein [Salmonella enterica subsp. enterica serovar Bovismorbificans]